MIEELSLHGLGVIEAAVLPLGSGLTVVTGETGAGKTMVITGLQLLFGGRADPARIRSGCDRASVEGRLTVADPQLLARVAEAGGDLDEDATLIVRRSVSAGGRSRAHVGGAATPVSVLAELGESLLAVHGQSDQVLLTRPARQRAVLDAFAGIDLGEYQTHFDRWRAAEGALRERVEHAAELRREVEMLEYGVTEIERADPRPGEDAELAVLTARLGAAEALRAAARAAHDAVVGDPDAALPEVGDAASLLASASRALHGVAGADPELDALAARLAETATLAADLGMELARYGAGLELDPAQLEQAQQRRARLHELARRYGTREAGSAGDVEAVLAWAGRARARLAEIDVSDEALARLAADRDREAERVRERALAIRGERQRAGERLARAVTAELAGLAMPGAEIVVQVRPRAAGSGASLIVDGRECGVGPDGADEVEILLRPHADVAPLPLGRGASGGELSRVMLALEVCLAGGDPVPTMVFDEVDAGVGGRAATEVGRRLARLARDRQVLVVTHLAQVAAFADTHVVVDKSVEAGITASDVRVIDGAQRRAELARMLSGTDSTTARVHAAELLAAAARPEASPEGPRNRAKSRR
ncbi:MAG: DNA repair protein RecN [Jatrophihabitans sp.]|nr:MAG: DNA repair protein RecN [Jatrophihabitans sp.]